MNAWGLGLGWPKKTAASSDVTLQSYSSNTWYVVDFQFDAETDKSRVRIDGGTWSSWTNFRVNVSQIDQLALVINNAGGAETSHWDDIQPMTLPSSGSIYAYAQTGYANPDAVTSIGTGTATTTYAYDTNGNLTSTVTGATTTTYVYDYQNRLTGSRKTGDSATTTYGYDWQGNRVFQKNASSTIVYPNKYFSVTSAQIGSTNYATSTEYYFAGDSLVCTIDQAVIGGGMGSSTNSGFKTAGTVDANTGWTGLTTTVLASSDDNRASCDGICDNSDLGEVSHFGFGVPAGASINGIEVQWECQGLAISTLEPDTSLSWNNGTNYTSVVSSPSCPANSDGTITMGGPTSTWGHSWTSSELSDSNFRLKIDKETSSRTLLIDRLQVKVYYTSAGSPSSTSTVIRYIHPDNLGSTNVVTDASGTVQTLDYYPYGGIRINTGPDVSAKKYIGQYYDAGTSLSYLNSRYYSGSQGQFLSQDPTFLAIGNPSQLQQLSKQSVQQFLSNPQQMNSYSYAVDNPITKSDPTGNQFCEAACADLVVYPAAAYFGPSIMYGIGAATTYITADMLLRNNGNGWGSRWGGTVPTLDPSKMGFGPPPMGPEDWNPNLGGKPPWMKWATIGTFGTIIGAELTKPLYELYQSLTDRGPQGQQILNQQFNSSSVQTRQQATQAYNAATGASTPQQQLWVTPNGAVVNWGGQVVAPAPSSSSNNKK